MIKSIQLIYFVLSITLTLLSRTSCAQCYLILCYPFDEGAGTSANDLVGGRDGTIIGGGSWSIGLIGGGAVVLDGSTACVQTPPISLGAAYSISAWVWINAGAAGKYPVVGNYTDTSTLANGFRLSVYGYTGSNKGSIRLETGNGAMANYAATANNVMPYNQWAHLVVTIDRALGQARIYVNGVDCTTDSSICKDFNREGGLIIGGGTGIYLNGGIDDFRIYSGMLSGAEIACLREKAQGPVSRWGLNGTTSNAIANGSPLTLTGSSAQFVEGGACEGIGLINLAGSYGYTLPANVGDEFTISLWSLSAGAGGGLVSNGSGGLTAGFGLYVTSTSQLVFRTGNGTSEQKAVSNLGVYSMNQWNHVAARVSRSSGVAEIFYNGSKVSTSNNILTDFSVKGKLYIGSLNTGLLFCGQLDDVRIYPKWLSELEIGDLAIGKKLGHWNFECNGNDVSGYDRPAVLMNGAAYCEDSVAFGSAALFLDGVGSGATGCAVTPQMDLGNIFSISLWANCKTTDLSPLLVNCAGSTNSGVCLLLRETGKLALLTGNGAQKKELATASPVFELNRWNHIAAVVDRVNASAKIYYNGEEVASGTVRGDFNTNAALYIGRLIDAHTFDGEIDEVRVYAQALTDTQVKTLAKGNRNSSPAISILTSSTAVATSACPVVFTTTASDPDSADTLYYRYDFGDNTRSSWSTCSTASHVFAKLGRYTVTAMVKDRSSTVTRTISQVVYDDPQFAGLSASANLVFDGRAPSHAFEGMGVNGWPGGPFGIICSELNIRIVRLWRGFPAGVPATDTVDAYEVWLTSQKNTEIAATLQLLTSYGVKVILQPSVPSDWIEGTNPMHLMVSKHESYAKLCTALVRLCQKLGGTIHGVELYNEPDGNWENHVYVSADENVDVAVKTRAVLDSDGKNSILVVGPGTSHCDWSYPIGDTHVAAHTVTTSNAIGAWSVHNWQWGINKIDPYLQRQYMRIEWADQIADFRAKDPDKCKPVYATESGVSATSFHGLPWTSYVDAGTCYAVDALPWAVRNVETALISANMGANGVIIWTDYDYNWMTEHHGLLRNDMSRRPSFYAFKSFTPDIPSDALMLPIKQGDAVLYASVFFGATTAVVVVTNTSEIERGGTLQILSDSTWSLAKAQQFTSGTLSSAVVAWDTSTGTATLPVLPADSIVTFVLQKN